MDFLTASPRDVMAILAVVVAGFAAGYAAGLFGIGGGVVLVPVLLTVLPYFHTTQDVVMHCAVGTCLALVVPSAIMASRKQHRLGNLDLVFLRAWSVPVAVGVVCGVILLSIVSTHVLKIVFTAYILGCTVYAALKRNGEAAEGPLANRLVLAGGGVVIGGLSVLLGIGGGTFTVPFLSVLKHPLKKAIASASATGLVIGIGGTIGAIITGWNVAGRTPYSLGFVNVPAFVVLAPIVGLMAPFGSQAASAMSERTLKWVYTAFLATIGAYMLYKVAA